MKIIGLTQGQYALIDDKDLPLISRYKWCARLDHSGKFYAVTHIGTTQFLMHRMLLGVYFSDNSLVDHISGNTLDNRRFNIRKASASENMWNRNRIRSGGGKFKGVRKQYTKKDGTEKYLAYIQAGHEHHTKLFDTDIEGALWYNEMAKKLHGEFARLNIIEKAA